MRIRSIKPEFFKHDGLAALPPLTRILFQGLWCMADAEGRLEDRAKRIKAEVVPYDDCNVDEMLTELAVNGFIVRYEVAGAHFIAIPQFRRHQRLSGTESGTPSRFPAPTEEKPEAPRKRRGSTKEAVEKQSGMVEGKGKEGKGDDILFPAPLDSPEFREAWESYIRYRKARKLSTLTDDSVRLRLAELAQWGAMDAIAAIQHTIANGWQGIFRPKHEQLKQSGRRSAPVPEMSPERAEQIRREEAEELEQVRLELMSGQ